MSNVETLANLPFVQRHGAAAFRQLGTAASPGTFLATVTGAGRPPVLYEVPHGLPFTELLALHGVSPDYVRGALMGGYFAGLLEPRRARRHAGPRDVARAGQRPGLRRDRDDHRRLPGRRGRLGAGVLRPRERRPVRVVLQRHRGNGRGRRALRDGVATDEDVARLRRWSVVLRGRGACATLDAATNVAAEPAGSVSRGRRPPPRTGACQTCAARGLQRRASLRGGGGEHMKIRLDRTICDGFGVCAKHAPEYFSLDDWGYASLIGDGDGPRRRSRRGDAGAAGLPGARDHRDGRAQPSAPRPSGKRRMRPSSLKTEANEANWGSPVDPDARCR